MNQFQTDTKRIGENYPTRKKKRFADLEKREYVNKTHTIYLIVMNYIDVNHYLLVKYDNLLDAWTTCYCVL